MLTHHITALALLVVSYAWNFHRYALIVMALHDPSESVS